MVTHISSGGIFEGSHNGDIIGDDVGSSDLSQLERGEWRVLEELWIECNRCDRS